MAQNSLVADSELQVAIANQTTAIYYWHNKTATFNLYFSLGGMTRKLSKEHVFPCMGLYALFVFWYCIDLTKKINQVDFNERL